jgi:hypothetical protein
MMASAKIHDLVEALDALRLLDLRHHAGAAAGDLLDLGDVLRALHEGHGDPVSPGMEGRLQVGPVLRGHGRDRDGGVRHRHPLPVRDVAADHDVRHGPIGEDLRRDKADFAVVEKQRIPDLKRLQDLGVRQFYTRRVTGHICGVKREACACR